LDFASIKELYDVTAGGPIGVGAITEFAWFRANDLPIFVWGLNNLPAGAANGDTLNIILDIPRTQSELTLWQKYASNTAGSPGTYVGGETPAGLMNGVNQTFTLANTPIKGAITLAYTPSPAMQPTVFLIYGQDFTVVGNVITIINPPLASSNLYAVYYH
jgi:hypothetical protein